MYERYWGLERKPFAAQADARAYYPTEVHQGSLLKLRYAVDSGAGAALLVGAPGTGKTLLIERLRQQLSAARRPFVHVVFPQLPSAELLAYLADELGAAPRGEGPATVESSLRRLETFLAENAARGQRAVVAIDEADLLEFPKALETLRLLINYQHEGQPLLTLVFAGHPRLLPLLDRQPGVEDRLAVKCLLRPLSSDETASYVAHQMAAAGATRTIFEPDAVEALHQLGRGIPRQINRLADLALLIGFAEDRQSLTAAEIENVAHELVSAAVE